VLTFPAHFRPVANKSEVPMPPMLQTETDQAPAIEAKRLRSFLRDLAQLVEDEHDEAAILSSGTGLLKGLIAADDWLDEAFTKPHPDRYQQNLLHADPRGRFSVVSLVCGPNQFTPIHDHTVWGLVGVLRGAERSQHYTRRESGELVAGKISHLGQGDIEAVSPRIGDIHQVFNALADRASISIHVYGANIGAVRRGIYGGDGTRREFISGYSNAYLPNIWDLSKE